MTTSTGPKTRQRPYRKVPTRYKAIENNKPGTLKWLDELDKQAAAEEKAKKNL